MFGEYKLRTQFIKIGPQKIHIVEERPGVFKYRRGDVKVIFKAGGERLRVIPGPAVGYGVKLLMIEFNEKVVVPPEEEMDFFLTAPVEVEVLLGSAPVDRFNIEREKYALYGTPETGAIARYWRSELHTSEPDSLGVVRLHLVNMTRKWMEMDHVIMYLRDTVMYYSTERAYYPLITVDFKSGVPEVNNTGKPPADGLTPTKEPLPLPNFLMRW